TEFARAHPLDTWTARNPLLTGNTLTAIAYGNGQFVAVGQKGTVLNSADGVDWVQRQSGTQSNLLAVAYGSGRFVTVGEGNTLLSSVDGVNWIELQSGLPWGTRATLTGVAYGDGLFVAVGNV